MDTSLHTLSTLFEQLGLPSDDAAIDQFVIEHSLASDVSLADADFWTPGQAMFLSEALADDSDWAEIVDYLDARLRAI